MPATAETTGRITDEGIARLRARIGVPEPHPQPPHYLAPGLDSFRHVAEAYGDDNPLWWDPEYAAQTRWHEPIAPPPMVGGDTLIGEDEVAEVPAGQAELMKGDPLRGVHAYYASSVREWWAPLRAGQRVWRRNALVGALDKESEFAGRAVHEWTAQVFRTDNGTILSGQYKNMIRTEREQARERKKEAPPVIEPYDEQSLAPIEEQYAREAPRGAEPRWWDDVSEGDEVGPLVKGPLTVTDMVCWHVGMGMGLYGVKPLRLAWENRQRIPRFYHRDDLGIPDVMQRVHWDPEFARRAGNPTTFDYGRMRETWLIHLCTDWMGDDAWLWRLDCEFRKFNYVGDTQWLRGRVTRKYLAEGDRPAVDLDLEAENQRGEQTTPGHATVLLPSREHGPVRLPDPPGGAADLEGTLTAIAARFDETSDRGPGIPDRSESGPERPGPQGRERARRE
ncbi:MAG: MaoC family dehydratase N-terminal domain-containing protein [Acidimicrobiia bacterium]